MKRIIPLILAGLFIVNGAKAQKETRDVDDFTKVSFAVAGKLYLKQGNKYEVILEGDRDYIEEIETEVRNDRLVIKREKWFSFQNKKVTVYITMPEIEGLSVSGSGYLLAEDQLECDELDLSVSGSGDIVLEDLLADELDCGISGSGSINLEGEGADRGEISISGSGNFTAESFEFDKLDVSISGSGRCKCYVNGQLNARVSGSGNIYYKGSPSVDAKSSGSGKVRKI
jgi:hypothetical protein